MKIIQSCWSCNQPSLIEYAAGWYGPEYNIMSWTLSCLQLKKYQQNVVLYADSVSARTLIDDLQLPYSEVHCELDSLAPFDPKLWALPKIHTYSKQEEPFLHVDGDVYIWQAFDDDLLAGDLIAQNMETETKYYEDIWFYLDRSLEFFPIEVKEERGVNSKIVAYNTGIVGGNDVEFFKEYAAKAMEFVYRNLHHFDSKNIVDFNLFFEQFYFFCIAKAKQKNVRVMLPDMNGGEEYWILGDFVEVPHNRKYVHLLGRLKTFRAACDQLANRLRLDYPEYFYRIISLFKRHRIPLRNDCFSLFTSFSDSELVDRHKELSDKFMRNKLSVLNTIGQNRTFECSSWRKRMLAEAAERLSSSSSQGGAEFNEYMWDIEQFELKLFNVLTDIFPNYSIDYLYARDINVANSFEIIFGSGDSGYNIDIVTDPIFEILLSQFDWCEVEVGEQGEDALASVLTAQPSKISTAMIPECNPRGYSLVNVDDLDLQLLEIFRTPRTMKAAISVVGQLFDEGELEDSRIEFEKLIGERVKIALRNKLLKISTAIAN